MKFGVFLIVVISICIYFPGSDSFHQSIDPPICVVGAGISGLNTAQLLEAKGYTVIIFDQNSHIGGKVETIRNPGMMVEMCPLLYTSSSFSILQLVDKYKMTSVPFNKSDGVSFDGSTGIMHDIPQPTFQEKLQIKDAFQRYSAYYHELDKGLQLSTGYLNADSNLFVSMSEWLALRKLQALQPLFLLAITVEGYGDLDHLPALYGIRFVSPKILLAIVGGGTEGFFSLAEGLNVLMETVANNLASPVNLQQTVTKIYRGNAYQTIEMIHKRSGRTYRQKCSAVILAFPPLLKYLHPMLPDLDNYERKILEQIKVHKYTTGVHKIPHLQGNLYVDRGLGFSKTRKGPHHGNGEVVSMTRQCLKEQQDIFTSYSWIRGDFDEPPTDSDSENIWKKLQMFMRKISPYAKTLRFKTSAHYFPHVTGDSLRQGFYQKFDTLQGQRGVYFATTLLSFETMDSAIEMSEDFVAKYF